ncbi:hypothetical protein DFJ74DRAFT_681950 [Hyaloraphidium curvatum]|nr:hypothetical protein DFJ74DRAFT_681950 [Hyaloraphidium curvatum]
MASAETGAGIWQLAASAASQLARTALDAISAHVRFEPPVSLFVSDAALVQLAIFVDHVTGKEPDGSGLCDVRIERVGGTDPAKDGFLVKGLLDGKPVKGLARLKHATLSKGVITVVADAPHAGVELTDRPAAGFFLSTVASLFGADMRGKILSAPLKEGRSWDGEKATLRVPLPGKADVEATMDVEHVPGGLKFVLASGSAEDVVKVVLTAAAERASTGEASGESAGGSWTSTAWSAFSAIAGAAGYTVPTAGTAAAKKEDEKEPVDEPPDYLADFAST